MMKLLKALFNRRPDPAGLYLPHLPIEWKEIGQTGSISATIEVANRIIPLERSQKGYNRSPWIVKVFDSTYEGNTRLLTEEEIRSAAAPLVPIFEKASTNIKDHLHSYRTQVDKELPFQDSRNPERRDYFIKRNIEAALIQIPELEDQRHAPENEHLSRAKGGISAYIDPAWIQTYDDLWTLGRVQHEAQRHEDYFKRVSKNGSLVG